MFLAIAAPALRAEGTKFNILPKILTSYHPENFMEMVEEVISRRRADPLMQLCVPMFERSHVFGLDRHRMRGGNFVQVPRA